jgi:ARC6-like, IMS domain
MDDRPEIVKKLEGKIQAILRDQQLATQAVSGSEVDRSPVASYEVITKDPYVTMGVRYLTLHCIASKQALYDDPRDPAQMLGVMSDEMGKVPLPEVVRSIQNIRLNYDHVYRVDPAFFDRAEANAKELMSRLPEDQQGQPIAQAKGTNLRPIPISTEPQPIPQDGYSRIAPQPAPTYISAPVPVKNPSPVFAPEASPGNPIPITSQIYTNGAPVVTAFNQPVPGQSNNKSALIIGGGMIAGAIVFSAIVLSQQLKQNTPTSTTSVSDPNNSPVSNASSSTSAGSSNRISQDEAVGVVQEWLRAKNTLFAPPYDQQLGLSLTTGKALSDNIRGPSTDGEAESSLEWLRNRGKYWKYAEQRLESVKNFVSDNQRAVITVNVFEQRVLYDRSGGVEQSRAKSSTTSYSIERSGGRLKISDFK